MVLRLTSVAFLIFGLFNFAACSRHQVNNNRVEKNTFSNNIVLDISIKVSNKFKSKIKNDQYMIWSISDVSNGDMVAVGLVEKPRFPMQLKLRQEQLLLVPKQTAPLAMSVRLVNKKNIFTPPAKGQLVGYLGGVREGAERNAEQNSVTLTSAAQKLVAPFKVDRLHMGDSASLEINRIVL